MGTKCRWHEQARTSRADVCGRIHAVDCRVYSDVGDFNLRRIMNKQAAINRLGKMSTIQAYAFLLRYGLNDRQAKELAIKYANKN